MKQLIKQRLLVGGCKELASTDYKIIATLKFRFERYFYRRSKQDFKNIMRLKTRYESKTGFKFIIKNHRLKSVLICGKEFIL